MTQCKRNRHSRTDQEWLQIPWDQLSKTRRRYVLLLQANYACSQCGYDKRRIDGHHIVEIDHIDGDHRNDAKENLRVLCPNCHALTPNFRNYGRTSCEKTSNRFRRGNKGYAEVRRLVNEKQQAYIEMFVKIVCETYDSKQIDYSKFGWVQQLSKKLNDPSPQIVGRTLRRLMPQFYVENCFRRRGGTKLHKMIL